MLNIIDKDDEDKKNSKIKGNETSDFSEQEASAIDVSHMDVDEAREGENKIFSYDFKCLLNCKCQGTYITNQWQEKCYSFRRFLKP